MSSVVSSGVPLSYPVDAIITSKPLRPSIVVMREGKCVVQSGVSRINVDTTSQIVVHLLEDGFVGIGDISCSRQRIACLVRCPHRRVAVDDVDHLVFAQRVPPCRDVRSGWVDA